MIFYPTVSKSYVGPRSTLEMIYLAPVSGLLTYQVIANGIVDTFLVATAQRNQYFEGLPFASLWTSADDRNHVSPNLLVSPGQWHLLVRNRTAAQVEVQVQINFQPTGSNLGPTGPSGPQGGNQGPWY